MALIGFWTWLFNELFGIALPYGWAWFLSQVALILIFDVVLLLSWSQSSFWPTARSGRRCRCAAAPMW